MTDSNFNTTDGTTPVPGTDISDTNQPGLHQEDINVNLDTTIPGYPEGSETFTVDYPEGPAYVAGDVNVNPFGGPDLAEVTRLLNEINAKLDHASQEHEHSAAGHDPLYDALNVLWEIKASIDHTNHHLHEVTDKLNRTFNS